MNYRFSIQSVGFPLLSVGAIKDYLHSDFLTMLTRQYMRKMRRMILIDFNQNKDEMIDLRFDNTNHQVLNFSTHHYQKMVKRLITILE